MAVGSGLLGFALVAGGVYLIARQRDRWRGLLMLGVADAGAPLSRRPLRKTTMAEDVRGVMSKVPAVTLGFWIIKILATTLGETAGDTISITMHLGYLVGTVIFATILVVMIVWQIRADRFYPALYWATIIASTTAGTAMADFADRSP